MDVPMLDEHEYKVVVTDQIQKAVRELGHCGPEIQQRTLELMAAEYERLTGFRIADPWHIFRHTTVGLGPPCSFCGKPLRTRRARLCGNCMKPAG